MKKLLLFLVFASVSAFAQNECAGLGDPVSYSTDSNGTQHQIVCINRSTGIMSLPLLGTFNTTGNQFFPGNILIGGVLTANQTSLTSRDCRADGYKADGSTDDSAALNACIANAKTNKQTHVLLPSGTSVWTANTINGTNFPGIHISGVAFEPDATAPPTQGQGITNIICNQGAGVTPKACMSLIGSGGAEIDHMVINVAKGAQGTGIGIVMGRDNSGGGGSNNPLCFVQGYNIHDIYITDNGGTQPTFNNGRGFIGIYNVSAENGLYNNVHILADTPVLFSQNNVISYTDPFVVMQTGCPLSMTGVTMVNPVLTASATTLPLIEANTTNAFSLFGFQCVGGSACIKFENTQGGSPTAGWVVTGLTEQTSADILATSVGLANMKFFMLIANPPPGVVFKPLAANLTFDQMDFLIDDFFALVPFIDNVQTGTQIRGSKIHIGFATSATNTTLLDSEVFAPTLTDANITFNAASNYTRYTSSGISVVGTFRADSLQGGLFKTNTNCSSSASPAVCGSAAAGSFVIAAVGTSVTVNTTAVTANSQIFIQEDESLGAKLSVTCNTGILANPPAITARVAATSFSVGITTGLAVNPVCFSYWIVN